MLVRISAAIAAFVLLVAGSSATASTLSILYRFNGPFFASGGSDAWHPQASLVVSPSGALFGVAEGGRNQIYPYSPSGAVFELTPPARVSAVWRETVIHSFSGTDGEKPHALIIDAKGNLYGVTSYRASICGMPGAAPTACGSVFEMSPPTAAKPKWQFKTLFNFNTAKRGVAPIAVILDSSGALYGTTAAMKVGQTVVRGKLFKLSPPSAGSGAWSEVILHTFDGGSSDASAGPSSGLVEDGIGVLFGETSGDGTHASGTVFELFPPQAGNGSWTFYTIYTFAAGRDGSTPTGGLILSGGAMFGTTRAGGGACLIRGGCGTVFQLVPPTPGKVTWGETVLHRFRGGSDGSAPLSGVVADGAGGFYGTTAAGGGVGCASFGVAQGCGTAFHLSPPGLGEPARNETILVHFKGLQGRKTGQGAVPIAGFAVNPFGVLYGATAYGGSACDGFPKDGGCGTVFALKP